MLGVGCSIPPRSESGTVLEDSDELIARALRVAGFDDRISSAERVGIQVFVSESGEPWSTLEVVIDFDVVDGHPATPHWPPSNVVVQILMRSNQESIVRIAAYPNASGRHVDILMRHASGNWTGVVTEAMEAERAKFDSIELPTEPGLRVVAADKPVGAGPIRLPASSSRLAVDYRTLA
jgi:hypothetical protein